MCSKCYYKVIPTKPSCDNKMKMLIINSNNGNKRFSMHFFKL